MAQPRFQGKEQSKEDDFKESLPKWEQKWFNKIIENKKNNPTNKVAELDYILCWGYGPKENLAENIRISQIKIRYVASFMQRVNNFFLENQVDIKCFMRLCPSPNADESAKVAMCNEISKDFFEEFKKTKNHELVDIIKWRTEAARVAAAINFTKYYEDHPDEKKMFETTAEKGFQHYLKNYPDSTKQKALDHYKAEITDVLGLMEPTENNLAAKGIVKENKFVLLFSEHDLPQVMHDTIKNSQAMGYKKDCLSAFVIPTEMQLASAAREQHGMFKSNEKRPKESILPSSSQYLGGPPSPETKKRIVLAQGIAGALFREGADPRFIGVTLAVFITNTSQKIPAISN
jgi:hypothetical protein